jgi:hypothetical protein
MRICIVVFVIQQVYTMSLRCQYRKQGDFAKQNPPVSYTHTYTSSSYSCLELLQASIPVPKKSEFLATGLREKIRIFSLAF